MRMCESIECLIICKSQVISNPPRPPHSKLQLKSFMGRFIRSHGEAGAVYYYISIDQNHAMKKGDCVELLVNYGETYEEVRERKGYGLRNAREGLGGDADDEAAKLRRNLAERKEIQSDIADLRFMEVRRRCLPYIY